MKCLFTYVTKCGILYLGLGNKNYKKGGIEVKKDKMMRVTRLEMDLIKLLRKDTTILSKVVTSLLGGYYKIVDCTSDEKFKSELKERHCYLTELASIVIEMANIRYRNFEILQNVKFHLSKRDPRSDIDGFK